MDEKIREILSKYRKVAVVGLSKSPEKDSYRVAKYLADNGYEIFPVNPTADEIMGRKAYKSLLEIPEDVDIVDVFRPSDEVPRVVEEVLERLRRRGDVKVLWLQLGIRHDEAARRAEEAGIVVVQDRCMFREHSRLFGGSSDR